jgi:YHS domain-containing protein
MILRQNREKIVMRLPATIRYVLVAFIFALSAPLAAQAASPEIFTGLVKGVAVGGYDTVAYFTEHRPVPGKADITYSWKGATWRFASAQNRDAFKASPEKYAPQYGGYCAYAVSQGATAKGDPKVWTVVDSKLYLNLSASVRETWEKDIPGYIKSADKNWPEVLK